MAIIHLFDLWLMYALVRVADLLILIYSHFDLLFFLGIFFLLLLLLFPSHQRFFFSPQEFISNLDRHSDTMFALICTLFMRKFRCQIIIVGPMTCTSVLCVCCACVWMPFFWFVYADRQSYNVNNIYCGVQSHRMLLVNTRIHIGLVQWNDGIYFHSQWVKQCNQMRMMFYVADLLYYLYTAVFFCWCYYFIASCSEIAHFSQEIQLQIWILLTL